MKLNALDKILTDKDSSPLMPIMFVGHGSPMNAVEENEFVAGWRKQADTIPRPTAIICVSAHWETRGTFITAVEHPKTIHDFGGFPPELYQVQYPAPGNPVLANEISTLLKDVPVQNDFKWGLDHGAWSVIQRMYPTADVPVLQLSLDYSLTPEKHLALAEQLTSYREKGVLFIGSGNLVHNLSRVAWDKMNVPEYGFDWALEANNLFKNLIEKHDSHQLAQYKNLGSAVQLAVPTPDHFLPLLYILAMSKPNEQKSFFNDKAVMGSLTMTSVKVG